MGNKNRRSNAEPENSGEAYQRDLDQLYGIPDNEEDNNEESDRNEPCDG